ncbi:hypothetical protein GQ457_03G024480 [Hibiscus cannabinus]
MVLKIRNPRVKKTTNKSPTRHFSIDVEDVINKINLTYYYANSYENIDKLSRLIIRDYQPSLIRDVHCDDHYTNIKLPQRYMWIGLDQRTRNYMLGFHIWEMVNRSWLILVQHIRCERNRVANGIAKYVSCDDLDNVYLSEPPAGVKSLVQFDALSESMK